MGTPDEIAQLRSDLVALMAQARVLAGRIDALEAARVEDALPQEVATEAVPDPVLVAKQEVPPELQPDLPPLRDKGPEWVAAPPPLPPIATRRPSFIEAASPKPAQPKPAPAPSAPGWTLGDALKKAYRALGPKEEMTWEMALGTYWLPRVAVLLLAVGVVWALTLAVQRWGQEWMPYLRIGTGYGIAAALFFGGRFIEHRKRTGAEQSFTDYARVMMAGGMALFYFVTFATYYVPYTRVFDQPYVTLALLTAIITAWGVVAEWRRSETLAFTVTLLGHFTVGLSTLTLPDPPGAAVAGLLLLNLGAGYFFARHGWQAVGLAGVLGGYTNYTLWLGYSTPSESLWALAGGMAVLAAYWTIFAVAEYIASGRDDVQPSYRVRSAYLGINSGSLVLLGVGLIQNFDAAQPYRFAFLFTCAAVFLAFGLLYRRTRPVDILYGTYLTKASAVFALGLADYFEGSALTLSLAVEAVVLLYSAKRSGLVAPRALAMVAIFVALGQGILSAVMNLPAFPIRNHLGYDDPRLLGNLVSIFGAGLGFFYFCFLFERTRWSAIPSSTLENLKALYEESRLNGLVVWPERTQPKQASLDEGAIYIEPENSRYIARTIAKTGSLYIGLNMIWLFDIPELTVALALFALAQLVASLPLSLGALATASNVSGIVLLPLWYIIINRSHTDAIDRYTDQEYYLASLLTAICLYAMSELLRIYRERFISFAPEHLQRPTWNTISARWAGWSTAGLVLAIWAQSDYDRFALPAVMAIAATLSLYALFTGASQIGKASFFAFFPGALMAIRSMQINNDIAIALPIIAMAWVPPLMAETRWFAGRQGVLHHQTGNFPIYLHLGTAIVTASWICNYWQGAPQIYALTVASVAAAALTTFLHPRALTITSACYVAFAALLWAIENTLDTQRLPSEIDVWSGGAVAITAIVLGRFFTLRKTTEDAVPEVLQILSWAMCCMVAFSMAPPEWMLSRELAVAIAFGIYAAFFRSIVSGALSCLSATTATALSVIAAYDSLGVAPRVAALGLAVLYWFALERAFLLAVGRDPITEKLRDLPIRHALVAMPVILLLITLERVPVLSSVYLTIAWTLAAVGVMGVALLTRERYYRYAALCMFTLALGRVMLVDTRQLDGMYRILAVLFLGVVLLAVGYGYIKARERSTPKPPEAE
jgi:hypothetical protein